MTRALLVLVLLVSGCNCGSKKKDAQRKAGEGDEIAEAPERARPRPRMPDRGPTRDVPGMVRQHAALSLEEAERDMPRLDARSLGPAAVSPNGKQVRFSYCVDAQDIAAAASSLVASLQQAGWTDVASRAPSGATTSPRHGIAGKKGDLRLSITVQSTRRTGCDSSVNQFFAAASMNRVAQSPPSSPEP